MVKGIVQYFCCINSGEGGMSLASQIDVAVIVASTVSAYAKQVLRETLQRYFSPVSCAWKMAESEPGERMSGCARDLVCQGVRLVVAAGGDGTVASVAHVLVGHAIPLGIIPMGTGNLVARELGIPIDVDAAVALLAGTSRQRRIDAMRIGGRTYLLNAGVGINADVIDRTSRLGKSLFGRSAYVGTAVWKVLQAKPQRLEVTVDGEKQLYHATDVSISNCGILAKALHPNGPDIRADDGQINVGILCMKSPLDYPWYYLLKRLAPQRENRIMRESVAKKSVVVRSKASLMVQADGDIIGTTPVEVEVMPAALTVLVPETE
jgi:diacylglycerol kinase family enzyme